MSHRRYVDDYLHLGNRRRLVQHLRGRAITDEAVLAAMARVPRHWFVAQPYENLAYEDRALPIGSGQTISQPYTVAYQSSLLRASVGQKVLEVGTGSGYQAAVLAAMGLRVYTLERHLDLHRAARALLRGGKYGRVRCFHQDGFKGLPAYGPFDRILLTAGAQEVPEVLLAQLTVGGSMVAPVGSGKQRMQRITRTGDARFETETFGDFRFVPFTAGLVHERPVSAKTGRPLR